MTHIYNRIKLLVFRTDPTYWTNQFLFIQKINFWQFIETNKVILVLPNHLWPNVEVMGLMCVVTHLEFWFTPLLHARVHDFTAKHSRLLNYAKAFLGQKALWDFEIRLRVGLLSAHDPSLIKVNYFRTYAKIILEQVRLAVHAIWAATGTADQWRSLILLKGKWKHSVQLR